MTLTVSMSWVLSCLGVGGFRNSHQRRSEGTADCSRMACGGREVKKNIDLDAESWLLITNQRYDVPLPPDEVRGIARSVERYRDHWKEQGLYYSDAETSAWCRRRGIKSGKVRRSLVKDRDAAIIQSVMSGESQADVAAEVGVAQRTVSYVVSRDLPLWAKPNISTACPWESEGISRRTWYRRMAQVSNELHR